MQIPWFVQLAKHADKSPVYPDKIAFDKLFADTDWVDCDLVLLSELDTEILVLAIALVLVEVGMVSILKILGGSVVVVVIIKALELMFADTDDPWWLVLMPGVGFDNVDVLINVAYELSGVFN